MRKILNPGKAFERDWRNSIPPDCFYLRINDPAQSFTQSDSALRFSLQNPFDLIMFKSPCLYCLELKSTEGSLTYWSEKFEDKTKKQSFNIRKQQILGLDNASKHNGIIAGFIFNFRKVNQTYFLSIQKFKDMIDRIEKKSFNLNDVIQSGAVLIEQTLRRKRYIYNVDGFISSAR